MIKINIKVQKKCTESKSFFKILEMSYKRNDKQAAENITLDSLKYLRNSYRYMKLSGL